MRRGPAGITLIEMLLVLAIVSLAVGISYPSVSSGLDSIRLRTACDAAAGFLNQAMSRVERLQQPVEISFVPGTGSMVARGAGPAPVGVLELTDGVRIVDLAPAPGGDPAPRNLMLLPGVPFPAVAFELSNQRGARRIVRIDPIAGVPVVTAP